MACPHTAGLAGLCLAADPNLTVGDLWVLIKNGANDIGDPGDDIYFGAGRIDANETLNYIANMPEPMKATDPDPANSATNQSVNVHLSWQPDSWAGSHDVYFGTDFNDVNDANTSSEAFQCNLWGTTFDPNTLNPNTNYYWRIDEKNSSGTPKGEVWNFITGPDSVIYVDINATGNDDGTSWADAFVDLQNAVEKAFEGDQIWVAEGTYKPTDTNDRYFSFQMHEGVALYGGFDATETDPNQRDPNLSKNVTILSGDIGVENDANDNTYHVLSLIGNHGSNTTVDRFRIVDGNAANTLWEACGGGVFTYNCQATIKDCTFTDNYAIEGGAIFNNGFSGTIIKCTFHNNEAYSGGAIASFGSSEKGFSIDNCGFDKNTARYGGAIRSIADYATVIDCNFTDSNAIVYGGAICAEGSNLTISNSTFENNKGPDSPLRGAIFTTNCFATVTNCTFRNNSGGIYLNAVWIDEFKYNPGEVNECLFEENDGGGITILYPGTSIKNCTFAKNYGFGIRNWSTRQRWPVNISNCLFVDNINTDESLDSSGGGICIYNSAPIITNCTFTDNSAAYGGGICNYSTSQDYQLLPQITNCTLWNNTATISGNEIYNWGEDPNTDICYPQIRYCDIKGCGAPNDWDPNLGSNGGGNIDEDPCFKNPDANDYHLAPNSPCIDAGDPNGDYSGETDIDGEPRAMGDCNELVDMGADEVYFPNCWNCDCQCHGDTDCDCNVTGSDFLAMKDAWYACYPEPNYNPCADFDRDGCVKGSDFIILKEYWFDPNVPDDCNCCGEDPNCVGWPPDQGRGGGGEGQGKSGYYLDPEDELLLIDMIEWLEIYKPPEWQEFIWRLCEQIERNS